MDININKNIKLMVFFKHFNKFLGVIQYIEKDLLIPSNTPTKDATAIVEKTYPNFFFFNWKGEIVRKPNEQPQK